MPYAAFSEEPGMAPSRIFAITWLLSQGYISDPLTGEQGLYHLTPAGWEYWQRLQLGPVLYWLEKNWFPAIVAAATILVGIGTILAQVLD